MVLKHCYSILRGYLDDVGVVMSSLRKAPNPGPLIMRPTFRMPTLSWWQGADAIANIILGDTSPAGRLPVTFYYQNYTEQVQ